MILYQAKIIQHATHGETWYEYIKPTEYKMFESIEAGRAWYGEGWADKVIEWWAYDTESDTTIIKSRSGYGN